MYLNEYNFKSSSSNKVRWILVNYGGQSPTKSLIPTKSVELQRKIEFQLSGCEVQRKSLNSN